MREPDCIFCAIMGGSAPASFVHRGKEVAAFMDINPVTPGHLLVVSTDHYAALADLPPTVAAEMFLVAQRCAAALRRSSFETEGINLFYADGAAALQEVFHAHLHVIPRFGGDTFRISTGRQVKPTRHELDSAAADIAPLPSDE